MLGQQEQPEGTTHYLCRGTKGNLQVAILQMAPCSGRPKGCPGCRRAIDWDPPWIFDREIHQVGKPWRLANAVPQVGSPLRES